MTGGPAFKDRVWIWAAYGENDIANLVAGGTLDNTRLEDNLSKLNSQLCTASGDTAIALCDPVQGLADQTIFADGFESGDTSAWTSTVP